MWKCKRYECNYFEGCNPFGNAPTCRQMEMKLKRMVMIKELKSCDELKETHKFIARAKI